MTGEEETQEPTEEEKKPWEPETLEYRRDRYARGTHSSGTEFMVSLRLLRVQI